MTEKEQTLRRYFDAWIQNTPEVLGEIFDQNILYSECWGPEYLGLIQVTRWFKEWNLHGQVLEWNIKQVIEQGDTVAAEWYFKNSYEEKIDEFDGVTIAVFCKKKIISLKEFGSKHLHTHPYN